MAKKLKGTMWEAIQPNEQKVNKYFQTGRPISWTPKKISTKKKPK